MAVSTVIAYLATLFSLLLPLSSSLRSAAVLDASEILSDAGYVSMSLTLFSLASQTQTLTLTLTLTQTLDPPSSLTVFAPSDAAFSGSGQPPLSLLRYHFSHIPLPPTTLRSLPAGAELPTLSPGLNLVVTSNSDLVSVNGVPVAGAPIFDDGSLVVYGVDRFLDPNFRDRGSRQQCGSPAAGAGASPAWLREASERLRRSGYLATALILDVQVVGFGADRGSAAVTVFAPADQAAAAARNDSDAAGLFLRHVVPCRVAWSDLANSSEGAVFPTFSEGFTIVVARSGDELRLNGVPVSQPDIYLGDSIAVHGLAGIFAAPGSESESEPPSSGHKDDHEGINVPENVEF